MEKNDWNMGPSAIEAKSFSIIDEEAGKHDWEELAWTVVRRMVHTSADFDYVKDTVIKPGSLEAGLKAIRSGTIIITDTKMAMYGINASGLNSFNSQVVCLIDHEKTKELALKSGSTRAKAAVDLAWELYLKEKKDGVIWVVGNAPTALFRLLEKLDEEPHLPRPALVVGLPVGFVNARESKEALINSALPFCISNYGRKGGSNVAASVINALVKLALASEGDK